MGESRGHNEKKRKKAGPGHPEGGEVSNRERPSAAAKQKRINHRGKVSTTKKNPLKQLGENSNKKGKTGGNERVPSKKSG